MAEQTRQTFNHFALVKFTGDFWRESPAVRREVASGWIGRLRGGVDVLHTYQTFGVEAETDVLAWSAITSADHAAPARFFTTFAEALAPYRHYVTLATALWGFTRPSQYTKTRSTQEL